MKNRTQTIVNGLLIVLITLVIFSCSQSANMTGTICGKYSEAGLKAPENGSKPAWLDSPGKNCVVGQSNWGNSTKKQAIKDAMIEAVGYLANELAGVEVKVESLTYSKKTEVNQEAPSSFHQSTYIIDSKGKRINLKVKKRAVWFDGYIVWVLVEQITSNTGS